MSTDDATTDDPWAPPPAAGGGAAGSAHGEPTRSRRPGTVVLVAVVLFAVGALFSVVAALAPFVLGHDAPSWLYLVAMFLTPVGFLLGLVAVIATGYRRPRRSS